MNSKSTISTGKPPDSLFRTAPPKHSGCGCGHGHSHGHSSHYENSSLPKQILKLGPGCVVYGVALVLDIPNWASFILFISSYLLIAWDILLSAFKNIRRGQVFDEFFLMTIATMGAFAINGYPEAVAVMLFFKVGELFQDFALSRSRRSIQSLLKIRPDYANLLHGSDSDRVSPEKVKIGDFIIIKPGERVPLDGKVVLGKSILDTSALTGESVPRQIKKGAEVLSGMINKTGLLTVRVTKLFNESTISKIFDLVENASEKKASTEKFITKFAKFYTPVVVCGAVLIATVPVLLYNINYFQSFFSHPETFSEWVYKTLFFLVISCPCALVISIPLGFFGGIGAASKNGILVKGSNFLEGLNSLGTIIWNKTGTLTKGVFSLSSIVNSNNSSKKTS